MKFPEKLWKIVNECISGAIGWGMDGDRIFIDYDKFEMEYLGSESGFKTKNVISFVRQLNLYGFRKCSRYTDVHEFKHPSFIRWRPDLVKLVKRKLGYRASINTEKLEVKMESKEIVPVDSQNELAPTNTESSTYNIFWNQMQHYCMLYGEWMQKNGHLLQKEPQNHDERRKLGKNSSASEDCAGQCSFEILRKDEPNNNIVYVPVPVPAPYGWPVALSTSKIPAPSNSDSSSDDASLSDTANDDQPVLVK